MDEKIFFQNLADKLVEFFKPEKIGLVGFGREGKSTLKLIRKLGINKPIWVLDNNQNALDGDMDENLVLISGEKYLDSINDFDLIMKSPGVSFKDISIDKGVILSSQTDLFLKLLGNQTIGITGTKGKSTTTSLIHHILLKSGYDSHIVGNIGKPAFEILDEINAESKIVFEMSSHQLEFVNHAPHISILLNLYQEHLDHYNSYRDYRFAKWNIAAKQIENDYFITNFDDDFIKQDFSEINLKSKLTKVSYSGLPGSSFYDKESGILIMNNGEYLSFERERFIPKGDHNVLNLLIALEAVTKFGLKYSEAVDEAYSFSGLPHRIEFVGRFHDIDFYNDSIATIPEATISAFNSLQNVKTLIIGGFDRGISYDSLIEFLLINNDLNIILTGKVGERISEDLIKLNYSGYFKHIDCFDDIVKHCFEITPKNSICLLSPAASSYDKFKNFEERGEKFKKLVREF